MASSRDQRSGKASNRTRTVPKPRHQPSEKAKQEIRKLDREQGVSAEMAAQLQAQWGNQAVAQLLNLSTGSELGSTAAERRDLGEDEKELLDRIGDDVDGPRHYPEHSGSLASTTQRGLPTVAAGASQSRDRQFGDDGEDDDDEALPLPGEGDGTALLFDRSGRGNLAKLQDHREKGRLPPGTLAAARSELDRGGREIVGRRIAPAQPLGDAQFHSPLEAWEDASLVAGRGCGIDERQDLAGPYDALGRPMAVGAFAQHHATTPLGRSLARLCATAPGTLMPAAGGLAGAAARLGSLTVLGMAADGLQHGSLRDRAVRTALAQAALELTLIAAGDVAESVPPAHRLYRRITGQRPGQAPPPGRPGPAARHWVMPALRRAGQLAALPRVRRWSPPPPPPVLDPDDPMSVVDAALRSASPDGDHQQADLTPLLQSIDALLAAGGRAQVELCTAALASRRPAFDGMIASTLQQAYRAFRTAALELVRARQVLGEAHLQAVSPFESQFLQANDELERLRESMNAARERCVATLAHISELG